MKLRLLRVALVGVLALGVAAGVSAIGPLVKVEPTAVGVNGKLPPGLDTTPVTVVVLLAGDPVAVVQEAAGRKLSKGEKDAVKAARKNDQNAITPQIVAVGGKIVTTFQSAVNGIKVQVASNKVNTLRGIPGVVDVKAVNTYERENVIGVPRVGAPAIWSGNPNLHGEGVKIAIIDTGIDYTHANFRGPGTVAAYNAAFANGKNPADPSLFGPTAPRVKGGYDLVGDNYDAEPSNATYQPVPHPDPNPLDCNLDVGHGSHVAGTAGGNGVLSTGVGYTGPYNATTYTRSFRIGPGVAPLADLYAIRVFGCHGSTDVVVEALEWAVDNDMDVVNMSLGSSYGVADTADALASDNAVKAGIVVVASAGNANDLRYITGSPASSTRTLSVAATTTPALIEFANVALPIVGTIPATPATSITAINANGATYTSPFSGLVKVVRNGTTSTVSLGCTKAAFDANGGVAGKIAVVNRGTCARVAKAIFGQQAGAIAVIMVNNVNDFPPYEGIIFQDPDPPGPPLFGGFYYDVTIPFFGVKGTTSVATSDGSKLILRDGLSITINASAPQISGIASFSSGGPRNGDSVLKPEISAPGSPIISTFSGTGNLQESLSGTSMASPHIAGVAALVVQAHPKWKPSDVKAAIVNSGDPSAIAGYRTHTAGSGFVNGASAAHTWVTAAADDKAVSLSFGLVEIKDDFTKSKNIKVRNDGSTDATFNVAATLPQGSPHTIALDKTQVKVKAHGDADVQVTVNVPVATAGNSDAFRDVAGLIAFTPASAADNGGIALRVPYYLVPRVQSNVQASLDKPLKKNDTSGNINLSNKNSPIGATADFYSWGLEGKGKGSDKKNSVVNLASAGVQSFPDAAGSTDRLIVFAVNTEEAWSAPSTREFDVYVDLDGDGVPEWAVVGIDLGLITTGAFSGQIVSAIYKNTPTGFQLTPAIGDAFADARFDGSTILLPVLASSLGISATNPRISYTGAVFDLVETGASDAFANWTKYNVYNSALSNGDFLGVPANASGAVPFSVNAAEFALTPPLGMMVVTQDNKNGKEETNLIKIDVK